MQLQLDPIIISLPFRTGHAKIHKIHKRVQRYTKREPPDKITNSSHVVKNVSSSRFLPPLSVIFLLALSLPIEKSSPGFFLNSPTIFLLLMHVRMYVHTYNTRRAWPYSSILRDFKDVEKYPFPSYISCQLP